MAVISFDIGGVITQNPSGFAELMLGLKSLGHQVIVVTAIGKGSIIPIGEVARHGFSHGRLYQLGINLTKHYDNCYTTDDYGSENPGTGHLKASCLKQTNADVHIDDRPKILQGIKEKLPNIHTIHFNGQSMDQLKDTVLNIL